MKIGCLIIQEEMQSNFLLRSILQDNFSIKDVFFVKNSFDAVKILQKGLVNLLIIDCQTRIREIFKLLRSLPLTIILSNDHSNFYEKQATESDLNMKQETDIIQFITNNINGIMLKENGEFVRESIFIKQEKKLIKVQLDDIVYIQGARDFIKIITNQKMFITYMRMKDIEALIPKGIFFA